MKAALVTGCAGLIGTALTRRLLEDLYHVFGVDNFITSHKDNLKPLLNNPSFTFIEHDITKPFDSKFPLPNSKFETIYHLACPTGVPNLIPLAQEMLLTSSIGTQNVLELARKTGASVVFTSSSEVYGNPLKFPQRENYSGNVDPRGLRSPYEEGKRFSEALIMMYVRKYKVDAKIVRVFNTYGPQVNSRDSRVVCKFIKLAQQNKSLTVEGKGTQTRTFCYVDDLVDGLLLINTSGKKGEVYNLGSDKEIQINDLAKQVITITNSKSSIKFIKRPDHDHDRRKPDLAKVKKLGWHQKISLKDGIRKTAR